MSWKLNTEDENPNSSERENVELLYVANAGFKGEDMPINKKNLIEIGS